MPALFARLKGNKNMTVILGVATVLIWAAVALRVMEPARIPSNRNSNIAHVVNKNNEDSIAFGLSLAYDDPFHLSLLPKVSMRSTNRVQATVKRSDRRSIEASDVFYLGFVTTESGEQKALVRHGSRYYYVASDDSMGEFLVKRVYTDSITLLSGNRVFRALRRKHL
jgi:hypothetical protein